MRKKINPLYLFLFLFIYLQLFKKEKNVGR